MRIGLTQLNDIANKIICSDSLKHLAKLKENEFDHCITDPPYNISGYDHKKQIGWLKSNNYWKDNKKFEKIDEKWDSYSDKDYFEFTMDWLLQITRVVKENGSIIIFGSYHNIYKIGFLLDYLDIKIINSVVWYKRNAFPNVTQRMLCESTEHIIWAVNNSKKKAKNWIFNYHLLKDLTENKKQMRNMWDIPMTPSSERSCGKHPSQKPISVMDRLIIGCSNPDEIIIDPFSGSGTTGVSALKNNRKYYLIDSNKEYVSLAKKRIKEFSKQPALF